MEECMETGGGNSLGGDFVGPGLYGYLPEERFREMLLTERKRTERSGDPFVLALVDISDLLCVSDFSGVLGVQKIMESLGENVRETDIRGWYERKRILGIVFTEIRGPDRNIFSEKIRKQVERVLGGWVRGQVEISVYSFPSDKKAGSTETLLTFYPEADRSKRRGLSLMAKRGIDILGAFLGLVIFSPLFLLIPFLIKLTSPGPVFFSQKRVGQGGDLFTFYKFRSMYIDSDDSIHRDYVSRLIKGDIQEQKVYKISADPRVTAVGRFLRKTSFDELPQFLNVLRGDMSLVGPRPPIPYETAQYSLWHIRRLMECKPGITGFWQVEGRSSTTFDEMVRMDLQYSRKRSLLLDLKLILKTPLALLTARGAY